MMNRPARIYHHETFRVWGDIVVDIVPLTMECELRDDGEYHLAKVTRSDSGEKAPAHERRWAARWLQHYKTVIVDDATREDAP